MTINRAPADYAAAAGSPLYRLCDRILIHFYSLHKVQTMFIIMQMSKKSNVSLCKFTIEFCVLLLYNVIKVSNLIKYLYELKVKRSDLN